MDKEFIIRFENEVRETIRKHSLVNKKDRVVVACSGGKDSTTTLYLLKKFGYSVEGLIIDLLMGEWSEKNLENTRQFCRNHGIKLHVINLRDVMGCSICYVRSGIQSKEKLGNCTICGVIKRWLLNKNARELGADRIATGHNLDDEAETVLMNIFTGNPNMGRGLGPTTGVSDDKFVERIKPLYFHTNDEIRRYSKEMGFPVLYEPCPCSIGSFRRNVRRWIAVLEESNPGIRMNIANNFLRISGVLRKEAKNNVIMHCEVCGEPSRNGLCKRCRLMEIMK